MIRPIILLLGILIVVLLLVLDLDKRRKIIIISTTMVLLITGLIVDSWYKTPRNDVVALAQVVSCGISAQHSYRSNFDFNLCLQNNATAGTIKRISLQITASDCSVNNTCLELQSVIRDISIDLPAGTTLRFKQNLAFDALTEQHRNLSWTLTPLSLKTLR